MKKLRLDGLQNAEHLALMSDVYALINVANLPALEEIKTKMQKLLADEDAAQMQIRKNEHTQRLSDLDEKRDRLYRGLVLRVQSEELAQSDERKAAATKILLVINTYGNFTAHNYQKETTDIKNFLADLKSGEYSPAMKKIGLEEWVGWLEAANDEFHTLYTNRRDEYAAQPSYDLKNIRREVDELFRKFHQTVEALEILQPSEALTTLIAKADASVSKWKDVLAQRKGKSKSAKEKRDAEVR